MVDGRSSELREETQRLLAERVARPELQTYTLETDRRFKELRAEVLASTTPCYAMLCCAVPCCTVLCYAVLCCAVLCCAVL